MSIEIEEGYRDPRTDPHVGDIIASMDDASFVRIVTGTDNGRVEFSWCDIHGNFSGECHSIESWIVDADDFEVLRVAE